MKTFENKVDEMIDVVVKMTWGYTILCALFEKKGFARQARETHPEFFLTIHDSLFCGFCVATSVLFNEKEKATSICNLIKEIETSKPDTAKKLAEKIHANRKPIHELEKIRNQVCAHRWEKKTAQDVINEVGPRVSMMKEVVDIVRPVILELAEEAGKEKRQCL